jgi:hypothetical protein
MRKLVANTPTYYTAVLIEERKMNKVFYLPLLNKYHCAVS